MTAGKDRVDMSDFDEAIDRIVAGLQNDLQLATDYEL